MGLLGRLKIALVGHRPGPGSTPVYVDDPRFDSWEVVRSFGELSTARAWHQALVDAGIQGALTADWPLDQFGRGEITLCVQPDDWSEAEFLLSNLDPELDEIEDDPY